MNNSSMSQTGPGHEIGRADFVSYRPNPLHVAIAQLEEEMTSILACTDLSNFARTSLQRRLRELKKKVGVGN